MPFPERNPPQGDATDKRSFGQGVFSKCDGCGQTLDASRLVERFGVCPYCDHHHRISAGRWCQLLFDDDGTFDPWNSDLVPSDPLQFSDGKSYVARVKTAQQNTQEQEAILTGRASMGRGAVAFGLFVFGFMGGSMGSVVGEKIARLFERAIEDRLPVLLFQMSGGARMQEGIFSLMQMAKAVAARERLREAGLPFVSVLLHPTTGGVAASFALLGDVNVAEPKALIGFAGPRVIESTIRQTLPDGFQRAEFLLEHGMVDFISPRLQMKDDLVRVLSHLTRPAL